MKKLLLLILPLVAITLNSCSKDDDGGEDNGNNTVALVKTITHEDWSVEYQYDNQNRVIKVIERDGNETSTINISYSTNKITMDWGGSYRDEYNLDANEFLVKYAEVEKSTGEEEHSLSFTYQSGYISKWNDSEDSFAEFSWSNGNMTEVKFNDGGDYSNTYTYSNYPNKVNMPIPDFLMDSNIPIKFKGCFSEYLPSSMTRKYGNTVQYTRGYSYTFNSDGNPTEIKTTDSDYGNSVMYVTYY